MVDLTIALISYNTRDLLLACLQSILETTKDLIYELVVVDNASADGSVEAVRSHFPDAVVLSNTHNNGYAKACNQALAISKGRHLLLLNSDTIISNHALVTLVEYLDSHPDVGAVSCKQWTGEGHLNQTCFPFPSLRDHFYHASLFQRVAPRMQAAAAAMQAVDCTLSQNVDWANGACLVVRTDLLRQLGGLDEGFFMYFEDVDLCRRIHRQGYRVHHLAEAEIVHLVGRSSGRAVDRLNLEWELSRIRYIEKHFSPGKRAVMKIWIAAGIASRFLRLLGGQSASPQRRQLMQDHLICFNRLCRQTEQPAPLRTIAQGRRS